ncbi:MAG: hypothetical protein IKP46_01865 [Bacteroidales bacterium]|nr:hypothetical protein [Bacteroidales bacterium]
MKRLSFFVTFITLAIVAINLNAQQKKPTLMILPSDNWCTSRYFMTPFDNQGIVMEVPNYQRAFREDSELTTVISKIGQLLTAKGYSLKDAEQEIKSVYEKMGEDNVTYSKSGASLAETPLDMIKRKAKMDILIQIWWKVNKESLGHSVNFTIEAFDSYTNKRIATSSGLSPASDKTVPVILENAIKASLKDFDKQMMDFYRDINKNGREIILTVKRWDSWEHDLETEYDGEELTDIIRKWIKNHTVGGNYNLSDATENKANYEQVRIPLYDRDGDGLDARAFAVDLRKYLSKEYGIVSKVMTRGLGEAIIVLGEK